MIYEAGKKEGFTGKIALCLGHVAKGDTIINGKGAIIQVRDAKGKVRKVTIPVLVADEAKDVVEAVKELVAFAKEQ